MRAARAEGPAACAGPGPGIPTVCGVAETGILGIEQRVSALLFSD